MWLPRILWKARQIAAGELEEAYAKMFCGEGGVDCHFLNTVGVTKEDILAWAQLSDDQAAEQFRARVPQAKIDHWNTLAPELGLPGTMMEARFDTAMRLRYAHLDRAKVTTVFAMLEADEGRA